MLELGETIMLNDGAAETAGEVEVKKVMMEATSERVPVSCSAFRRAQWSVRCLKDASTGGPEDSFLSPYFHLQRHQSAQGFHGALPLQKRLTIYLSHIKTRLPTSPTFYPFSQIYEPPVTCDHIP